MKLFFRTHWPFLVLLIFFLAARLLAAAQAGSFWFDEAFSVHFTSMEWTAMWHHLQFEHNPLLSFVLLHGWMQMFGESEFAVRSLSIIYGLLSMIGLYALGTRLFSKTAGWWVTFFMTASTIMLYHQTEARMYGLLIMLAIACLYFFWTPGRWRLPLYVLSAIALTHTHITAWSLVIAIFLYQLAEWNRQKPSRRDVWRWIAVHALIAMAFLLWFIPVALNKMEVGGVAQGWFFAQHTSGYWLTHLTNFLMNGEDRLLVRSLGGLLVIGLLFASIFSLDRPSWWQKIKHVFDRDAWPLTIVAHWTPPIRLLLFCLFIPLLIGFALQVTVTKYLLVAAVPLFLLMGHTAAKLNKKLGLALALVTLLLVLPLHLRLYTSPRHHWDKAAQTVEALKQQYPDSVVVIHSFSYALPLQRYLDPRIEVTPFYPLPDSLTFDERVIRHNWHAIVNQASADAFVTDIQPSSVILVSSTTGRREEDPLKSAFLSQGWRINNLYTWPGYGDPEILFFHR
ncbi:MAG: glycosyltransferase family 39 protein [Parcubacteria group bacterium]|nr:glycosyltransferase family 39 protein [Parcubacteria group bacterium]